MLRKLWGLWCCCVVSGLGDISLEVISWWMGVRCAFDSRFIPNSDMDGLRRAKHEYREKERARERVIE